MGALATVSVPSATNTNSPKSVTATCPPETPRAIAGGARMVDPGLDRKVGLTISTISGTNAWTAEATQLLSLA